LTWWLSPPPNPLEGLGINKEGFAGHAPSIGFRGSVFFAGKGIVMASKKQSVEIIALQCSECKRRNYTTKKNRKNSQEKLELNKYCKWDKKHTLHKESKVK
jgi:large subunit ribosomal protein L33